MKMLMRHGLLGLVCQLLFWLVLFALAMQFLVKVWPAVVAVLVLVAVIVVWRKRRKRNRS